MILLFFLGPSHNWEPCITASVYAVLHPVPLQGWKLLSQSPHPPTSTTSDCLLLEHACIPSSLAPQAVDTDSTDSSHSDLVLPWAYSILVYVRYVSSSLDPGGRTERWTF